MFCVSRVSECKTASCWVLTEHCTVQDVEGSGRSLLEFSTPNIYANGMLWMVLRWGFVDEIEFYRFS
jgi:hypothetical protein